MREQCPQFTYCEDKALRYEEVADVVAIFVQLATPNSPEDVLAPDPNQIRREAKAQEYLDLLYGPAAQHMREVSEAVLGGCMSCPIRPICEEINNRDA